MQVNRVSRTRDGEHNYDTRSLLASWDRAGDENEPFLEAFNWAGEQFEARFEFDFLALDWADRT
ncbi:MAG: hypothetical protein ACOCYE_02540 [Pseudomonadota bacterium]